MTEHVYRIGVVLNAEVRSDRELTRAELESAGQQASDIVAVGQGLTITRQGYVDVSITTPHCAAPFPRGRRTLAWRVGMPCDAARSEPVHGSAAACDDEDGCPDPDEHHEFVSPGFETPVDEPTGVRP